jgi:hypothetical protein
MLRCISIIFREAKMQVLNICRLFVWAKHHRLQWELKKSTVTPEEFYTDGKWAGDVGEMKLKTLAILSFPLTSLFENIVRGYLLLVTTKTGGERQSAHCSQGKHNCIWQKYSFGGHVSLVLFKGTGTAKLNTRLQHAQLKSPHNNVANM